MMHVGLGLWLVCWVLFSGWHGGLKFIIKIIVIVFVIAVIMTVQNVLI